MKSVIKLIMIPAIICMAVMVAPTDAFARKKHPDVTFDGLERVKKSKADLVYVLPEADLSGYDRLIVLEPEISFRKGWQSDQNSSRSLRRISNSDMERMIKGGKEIFADEFTKVLKKRGYDIAEAPDDDVLLVRPAIVDLDVKAPDPNNMNSMYSKTYTDGAGEATLVIELYDSVTKQILVRAIDTKADYGDSFGWRMPRSQTTNIMDARDAFASWAKMLATGLDKAKKAKLEEK